MKLLTKYKKVWEKPVYLADQYYAQGALDGETQRVKREHHLYICYSSPHQISFTEKKREEEKLIFPQIKHELSNIYIKEQVDLLSEK